MRNKNFKIEFAITYRASKFVLRNLIFKINKKNKGILYVENF